MKSRLLLIATLLFATRAFATTVAPANLAQMAEAAQQGFHGIVESVTTTQTQQGWGDQITCRVISNAFNTPAMHITWIQARTSAEQTIPGMPKFTAGEEHLIFLSGKAPGSIYQAPIALEQGDFKVYSTKQGARVARNSVRNTTTFAGLDRKALQTAVATHEKSIKSPTASKSLNFDQTAGANDLTTLIRLAATLHADAATGTKPSIKYATPTTITAKAR